MPNIIVVFLLVTVVPIVAPASTVEPGISDMVPWQWSVKPEFTEAGQGSCPSEASILGTFGFINAIVSIASLIIGHRSVVKFLTCGYLGKNDDQKSWFYTFIFPLGFQLGANAWIASLYQTALGFDSGFSVGDLTLFYTTRPRLSWLVLAFVMIWTKDRYIKATKAAAIAEFLLQLISSYYSGMTVHFASKHHYYNPGHLTGENANDARLMYVGALISLIFMFPTLCSLVFLVVRERDEYRPGGRLSSLFVILVIISCTSWLGSWLFWIGFVRLAGET